MQRFKLRVGTAVTMSMVLLQLVFVGDDVCVVLEITCPGCWHTSARDLLDWG